MIGSEKRPIGSYRSFLEDVRAREFSPELVLDVGANQGLWTTMAKDIWPDANFLLIEPQVEMKKHLDDLCSSSENVAWIEAGAGAEQGKLALTMGEDLTQSTFLPYLDKELLRKGQQREISMITIDSLLASRKLGAPDLVKLDVQGFELEVLRGADSLIGSTELFVMEVSLFPFMPGMPVLREVIEFMGERGYEVYDIAGYLRRPLDGALGQIDLAFARSGGLLRRSSEWS